MTSVSSKLSSLKSLINDKNIGADKIKEELDVVRKESMDMFVELHQKANNTQDQNTQSTSSSPNEGDAKNSNHN